MYRKIAVCMILLTGLAMVSAASAAEEGRGISKVEFLRQEISKISEETSGLKEDRNKIVDSIESNKRPMAQIEKSLARLKKEYKAISAQTQTIETSEGQKEIVKEISRIGSEIDLLKAAIEQKREGRSSLELKLDKLKEKLSSFKKSKDETEIKIQEIGRQEITHQTQRQKARARLLEEKNELKQSLIELDALITKSKLKSQAGEKAASELQGILKIQLEELESERKLLRKVKTKVGELTKRANAASAKTSGFSENEKEIAALEASLDKVTKGLEKAESQESIFSSGQKELNQKIKSYVKRNKEIGESIIKKQGEIETLAQTRKQIPREKSKFEGIQASLTSRQEALERQIAALTERKQRKDNEKRALELEVGQMQGELKRLNTSLSAAETEVTSALQKRGKVNGDLTHFQNALAEIDVKLNRLYQERANLKATEDEEVTKQVRAHISQEITALESQIKDYTAKCEGSYKQLAGLKGEIKSLQAKTEPIKQDVKQKVAVLARKEDEVAKAAASKAAARFNAQLSELEQELSENLARQQEVSAEILERSGKDILQKDASDKLGAEIISHKKEIELLSRAVAKSRARISTNEKRLSKIDSSLKDLSKEKEKLEQKRSKLVDKRQEYEPTVKAKQKITGLLAKLKVKQSAVGQRIETAKLAVAKTQEKIKAKIGQGPQGPDSAETSVLKKRRGRLGDDIKAVEAKLEKLSELKKDVEFENRKDELVQQKGLYEQEILNLQEPIDGVNNKLTSVDVELNGLTARLEDMTDSLVDKQLELKGIDVKLRGESAKVESVYNSMTETAEKHTILKERDLQLRSRLLETEKTLDKNEALLSSKKRRLKAEMKKQLRREKEIANEKARRSAMTKRQRQEEKIDVLEERLDGSSGSILKLQKNRDNLQVRIGELTSEVESIGQILKGEKPAQAVEAEEAPVEVVEEAPVEVEKPAVVVFGPDKGYTILANDIIEIAVYDEPDLTKTVRVAQDGTISYPLLGRVRVSGLSPAELEEALARLLGEGYIVNPQVSVFVQKFAKITVLGEVNHPGTFELEEQMTVLDAIAKAGGFTDVARVNGTRVIRVVEDQERTINIKVTDITRRGRKDENIRLMPGDIVYIPESFL